ncbi:MAG TPA: GNAT family N-acetyltransferase [Candidatus Bathyarchaeia archaeon]|jgi:GNAT superfamily N-acetyltransferase|nr:GNAT family N-acetyltransferase [Candidatus Bathyarchaeia archaeon]
MKPRLDVCALRPDERDAWQPLWEGYLTFYNSTVEPEVTNTTWARLHDPAEPMHVLGAFLDGKLVGIVHYLFHRSTWTTGDYCYLQDLFTAPEARGQGAGRALIEAVYDRAEVAGASRVYWLTHETNAIARALYDTLADRPGFIQYRHLLQAGDFDSSHGSRERNPRNR